MKLLMYSRSVNETMSRSAVGNFVDVKSSKLNRLQQASTTRPYLPEYKSAIFPSEFGFFLLYPNLPSKQGVAGSSPAGRAFIVGSLRAFSKLLKILL